MTEHLLYLFHVGRTSADAPQWLLRKIAAFCEKGELKETDSAFLYYAFLAHHAPEQRGMYETFHFSTRRDMEEAYRFFEELADEHNQTCPEDGIIVYRGAELDEMYERVHRECPDFF
jgi:hypothetical protein